MTTAPGGQQMQWLLQLQPAGAGLVPTPASRPATIAAATAALGLGPVDWAIEVGHAMATRITAEIPELSGGPGPFLSLRMGTESATLRSLLRIVDPEVPLPAITEEALVGDREFVRRGVTLDRVLRGVRLGHAGMARAYMAACQQLVPDEERVEVMQQVSERLFDYIDEFAGSMATEYVTERDRWVTSAAAAREEAVRALIDGHDDPPSAIPDYDLSRAHVGLLLWFDPVRSDADTAELQRAALEVLRHWDCTQTLVVPIGRARLWAWGSRRSLPDHLQVNGHEPDRPDVAMAYGSPGAGLAGFRRTHREALAAERIHKLAQPTEHRWATSYAQVEIAALLTDDLPAAAAFLRRHLGPLAADTAPARDLRRTLLAYLEQGNSPHLAAQRLHVSRNTVNYRIKRVEELLGPDWRERSHPLQTALVVLRDIGDDILWRESHPDPLAPPAP